MRGLKISDVLTVVALVVLAVVSLGWPAQGACFHHHHHKARTVATTRYRYSERAVIRYAPAAVAAPAASVQPTPQAPTGDLFVGWNALRARYGLPAVAHDPNLSNWAAMNNSGQLRVRYSSHHTQANAYQAAYFGAPSTAAALDGFLASPSHRGILLHPGLTRGGAAVNSDGSAYAYTINAQ